MEANTKITRASLRALKAKYDDEERKKEEAKRKVEEEKKKKIMDDFVRWFKCEVNTAAFRGKDSYKFTIPDRNTYGWMAYIPDIIKTLSAELEEVDVDYVETPIAAADGVTVLHKEILVNWA